MTGAAIEAALRNKDCNIGRLCTLHQCESGLADKAALIWVSSAFDTTEISFRELERQSNRFANVLTELGLKPGDVFFTYLPKMPEQFFAFLGALKLQLLTGALFSNFGEDALFDRLADSRAKVLLTRKSLLKKVLRIRSRLPDLSHIILLDGDGAIVEKGVHDYATLMDSADDEFKVLPTNPETPSVLHYTSGSTGKPKGVVHAHRSIAHQAATATKVLGLVPDDIFWCTADQGWVTGTTYGIIAPWSAGISQVHFGGGFDAAKWFTLLQEKQVSVWYTAPTALRMLMMYPSEDVDSFDLSRLRSVFSVGEPLNAEVVHWGRRVLKRDIYDTWFQTETGGIMIANKPGLEIKPGSMGCPVDGVEAAILGDDWQPQLPGVQGNLCLKPGWSSLFATYLNNTEVYEGRFKNGYYITGDIARRDSDGYFWFLGRSDDIINTGGHLISPFEIESALLELEEVVESAAVAVPDELLFEKVVVFVAVQDGIARNMDLELKIRLHLANRVSTIATPGDVVWCDRIPKNNSGKIMRRVLKARYLGIDEGDISTMAED